METNQGLAITADLTGLARISNIQTVEVTDVALTTAGDAINVARIASSVTGVKTVGATGGAATFTFNAGTSTLSLGTGSTAAGLGGATGLAVAGSGTDDVLSINRTNTDASAVLATAGLTVSGIETVNIGTGTDTTTSGTANAQTTGLIGWTPTTAAAALTLNITGSAAMSVGVITPAGASLLTIDGSGMTARPAGITTLTTAAPATTSGTVKIIGSDGDDVLAGDASDKNTITGGLGNDSITGGSANDSLSGGDGKDTINSAAGNDYLDGGSGNDTIVVAASLTTADTVDGGDGVADILSAESAQLVDTNTYTKISNIEQVTVSDALGGNIVLSQIQAGISQVNLADTAIARTITFDSGVAGTVKAAIDIGGALTVASAGTGTTDQITLGNSSAATNVYVGRALNATGVETLVINTTTTTAGTSQTAGVITISPTSVSGGAKLTVTGNGDFVATKVSSVGTGLLTIDASGITDLVGTSFTIGAADALGGGSTESIIGSAGNDVIATGNYASTVDGGSGNDSITGGTSNDNLSSLAGHNTLTGGGGKDTLTAGAGNDSITGGSSNDLIDAGAGLNTIVGGGGKDTITSGDGNDDITGGSSIDVITSNGGKDTIVGGGGNDVIDAGSGDDTITVTVGASDLVSVIGGAGNDTLTVTSFGNVTSNEVFAGGDDTLDVLSIAASNATAGAAVGATGWEVLQVTTSATVTQALTTIFTGDTTISRVDFTGTGNGDKGITKASATVTQLRSVSNSDITSLARTTDTTSDSLTVGAATTAASTLATLTVNDEETLTLGAGAVTTAGTDFTISTLNAIDVNTIYVTGSQDTIVTAVGTSAATTGFGTTVRAITLDASAATGTVSFTGDTALSTQALTMTGSTTASNTLVGGSGNDIVTGGSGADLLTGNSGNDSLTGNTGSDSLNGGDGNDTLRGGDGSDSLDGGSGTDKLYWTGGVDTIVGGAGTDTLHISQAEGATTIANYTSYNPFSVTATQMGVIDLNETGAQTLSVGNSLQIATVENIDASGQADTTISLALIGTSASNSIVGGAGNDYVRGADLTGTAATNGDTLVGGDGVDYLRGDGGADLMFAGAQTTATSSVYAEGAAGTQAGNNAFWNNLFATNFSGAFGNTIAKDANILEGKDGDDILVASSGKDTFFWQIDNASQNARGTDVIHQFKVGQDNLMVVNVIDTATELNFVGNLATKFAIDALGLVAETIKVASASGWTINQTSATAATLSYNGYNGTVAGTHPEYAALTISLVGIQGTGSNADGTFAVDDFFYKA